MFYSIVYIYMYVYLYLYIYISIYIYIGLISAAQSGLKTGICQLLSEQLTHLTLTSSGTYYF